jgi:transcriptional regulator with XRE-family HTH domain
MTQEEMCEMTTFSKRSLSDYENGVTIPYKHLREISALLGRDVAFFLHGEPEAKADSRESILLRLQELRESVDGSAESAAEAIGSLALGIERIEEQLARLDARNRRVG